MNEPERSEDGDYVGPPNYTSALEAALAEYIRDVQAVRPDFRADFRAGWDACWRYRNRDEG